VTIILRTLIEIRGTYAFVVVIRCDEGPITPRVERGRSDREVNAGKIAVRFIWPSGTSHSSALLLYYLLFRDLAMPWVNGIVDRTIAISCWGKLSIALLLRETGNLSCYTLQNRKGSLLCVGCTRMQPCMTSEKPTGMRL
jgi:hypothetical protein